MGEDLGASFASEVDNAHMLTHCQGSNNSGNTLPTLKPLLGGSFGANLVKTMHTVSNDRAFQ